MKINHIIVAGAGTMGYSMAQIFSRYHYKVTIYDISEKALHIAKEHIEENTMTMLKEHEITSELANEITTNIHYTTNTDCFKNYDLVVENIIENIDIKKSFYEKISMIVKEETILATNTSGLSINALATSVNKPERFIGMHWFNPSHLILLIEIIKSDFTLPSVAQSIYDLSLRINKKPVIVNKDVPGFVANRIQFAVLREALDLIDKDIISKNDMDDVMKYGLGFRYACLGPLEVADFGGLDTFYHISSYLMKDLCNNTEIPTLLKECYDNKHFGIKTKHGFYEYENNKDIQATISRDEKLLKLYNALYK